MITNATGLADLGAIFAYIWAGLMFATGMFSNIGITAVADLDETDPEAAEGRWSSIDTVTDGLVLLRHPMATPARQTLTA